MKTTTFLPILIAAPIALASCADVSSDLGAAAWGASDPGCIDPWIGACPVPPRQIAPMSGSRHAAPAQLEWQNPVNVSTVQLQICPNRTCRSPLVETNVTGESYTITGDLGRVYWRVGYDQGRSGWHRSPFWLLDTSDGITPSPPPALDVNGDHLADVVIGDPDGERAHVFLGQTGGPSATPSITLTKLAFTTEFGGHVADAGDVDGDGYRDLIVSAAAANSFPPQITSAFVYHGGPSGVSTMDSALWRAPETAFGLSAISVGDMDHDGFGDIAIGTPAYGSLKTGRVEVFRGGPTGISLTPALVLDGAGDAGDNFGVSLALADLNGDGLMDLVVGETSGDFASLGAAPGRVHVFEGNGVSFASAPSATLSCPDGDNLGFGFAISTAGDRDGDGLEDLAVGAYGYASVDGRAYVFPGGATGVGATPIEVLDPPASRVNGYFGFAIDGGDDVDHDGQPDLLIGETDANGFAGQAHIFYGSTRGPTTPLTIASPFGGGAGYFGQAVSMPGDLDGDNVDDVAVGAPAAGGTGAAAFYDGVSGGLVSTTPSLSVIGPPPNGGFGITVTR